MDKGVRETGGVIDDRNRETKTECKFKVELAIGPCFSQVVFLCFGVLSSVLAYIVKLL